MGRIRRTGEAPASVLGSLAAYAGMHMVAARLLRQCGVDETEVIMLAEKLPSTVSAIYTSSSALQLLVGPKSLWRESWSVPYSEQVDRTFARHIGYTIYDLITMTCSKQHPSAWIHHVFSLFGTSAMRFFKQGSYFPMCYSPAEATVVITNLLYVVQKFLPHQYDLITALLVVRALAFTVFRLLAAPLCIRHAIMTTAVPGKDADKVTFKERAEAFVSQYFKKLHPVVSVGAAVNVTLFTGLNTWWTLLTYRALWRHLAKGRTKLNIHHI
ncbi:hypothetical protein BC830DRAFT_1119995 [Chytriomyces sp. MP71]|nr:hypothetical protein BC830DRAFT_1119995 [Chytriomyces sp. MP71]